MEALEDCLSAKRFKLSALGQDPVDCAYCVPDPLGQLLGPAKLIKLVLEFLSRGREDVVDGGGPPPS